MRRLRFLWALCLTLSVPAMADAVDLLSDSSLTDLVPFVQYACMPGPDVERTPPRIDSMLYNGDHQRINLGYSDTPCWFHVGLHNLSAQMARWAVQVDVPNADHIDAIVNNAGHSDSFSLTDSHSEHLLTGRRHTLLVEAPSDAQIDLWLRVQSRSYLSLGLNVSSIDNTLPRSALENTANGLFYGVGLTLFVLHLLLFFALPRQRRLAYQAYLALSWLYIAQQQGALDPLLQALNSPPSLATHLLAIGSAWSGLRALISLLRINTGGQFQRRLHIVSGLGLIIALMPLLPLPVDWIALPCIVYVDACLLACLSICVWHWRQDRERAIYCLLAWTPLSLLGMMQTLIATGLIERAPVTTALQWALIFQHLILSFLIVMRVRQLEEEAESKDLRSRHALAENEAKSAFLATISHEIRTPMNGVLGIIELLRDTPLSAQQKTYVNTVYNSGQTLLAIINDVLDYSKIQAGMLELESTSFDLESLVHECVAIFTPQSREKKVPIDIEFAEGTLAELRGDPLRLRQILLNLLSNALKFTDSGKITIKLRTLVLNTQKVRLECSVQDTGSGIEAEQLPHLFQYFRQADSSTTRRYGGSGLGLAICKQLTELMGGSISAESHPQQGACFNFNVILQIAPKKPTPANTGKNPAEAETRRLSGRILLVEDNKVNQMVVLGMLRKLGLQAAVVENGLQAVSYVQAHPVQLILMDCEMPIMDGYEATRRIRQLEQTRQRPACIILALTAHAMPYHRESCLAAGMNDHLTKPITLAKLQTHLLHYLS